MKTTAIVLAAGQGKRMGTKIQKQFLEIKGYPVLYYSMEVFQKCPFIEDIILVTSEDCIEYCEEQIVEKYQFTKVSKVVAGGKERYDSVYQGLCACDESTYVFIHDGARPFITQEILERAYDGVQKYHACVVGMPVKDTIKIADTDGNIEHTPARDRVWMIQTPQVFSYPLIKHAYDKILQMKVKNITDDAMVVERVKACKVRLIQGSYENIKITTPEDLKIAEVF